MDLRIAVAQAKLQCEDVSANILHTLDLIDAAVEAGAKLIVLPELANSGYLYRSKSELAEALAGTDAIGRWAKKSEQTQTVIVSGFAQMDAGVAYNRSVIIDKGKILHVYTKLHLWNSEKEIFTPGDHLPEVTETSVGRITTVICYDMEFPELIRIPALQSAQLIAAPTNWPAGFQSKNMQGPFNAELIKAMAQASFNHIWIAVADRAGLERGTDWLQSSAIIDPDGWPIAMVGLGAGIAVADINLDLADDKSISPNNDVFADRRSDLY